MLLLSILLGYLLGGVPFSLAAGYLAGVGDIRQHGSGNIGATNVWRTAGPGWALLATVLDIGKGVAAVLIARLLISEPIGTISTEQASLLAGLCAVIGHTFPIYLKFRGGKGVNTALGVFLILRPLETAVALIVFILLVLIFKYISLGSMLAAVAFAIVFWLRRYAFGVTIDSWYLVISTLLAAFILYTHRQNIKRLLTGTENRFKTRKVS